jgi:hypothetical protein
MRGSPHCCQHELKYKNVLHISLFETVNVLPRLNLTLVLVTQTHIDLKVLYSRRRETRPETFCVLVRGRQNERKGEVG